MTVIRAEVVGSLLRPDWLKRARSQWQAGDIDHAEFKRIEDRAVREALAIQEEAGVDIVTDGEQRRTTFFGYLTDALSGIDFTDSHDFDGIEWQPADDCCASPRKRDDGTSVHAVKLPVVTEKLARSRALSVEEFAFLRAATDRPVKITLPSPLMAWSFYSPKQSGDAYADIFDMFTDVARLIREEVEELAALGCTYVQIDAPELAILIDPDVRERVRSRNGLDTARLLVDGVAALDEAVAGVSGITKCLHICRGNNAGSFFAKGGYETISRAVFAGTKNYDLFSLEYDDHRSGSFEPLRDIPDDKGVILGLISTKLPALEKLDELEARVEEAARVFPKDQLRVSPQCGFASTWEGNPLTPADQAAKLGLVKTLAQRIWG
ncbi:cobalamin-independent methionine synthase II family protein [Martelella alba]|uniref:Cobalamin-independent methionine synthase II family protein n=1 Tax=Martelella alba TaxID=2590451 RepID=A0A506UIZ2_9HYPH|nr:cobalamin-independent methionine synthase II family protein [Martelella alba]TPW33289.1 cobalamin-independent methionine synthase II family protein [Martelella alba]